jgi:hypothetical protein
MTARATATTDRRALLSALWVFVLFNYLYGDLAMMIFRPGSYQAIAARMSQWLALAATALMELLIAMVVLVRILKYPVNRRANIIAGVVGTAFVAVTLSPRAPPFYLFLSVVEMACTVFIVWYAWTWPATAQATDVGA